MRKRAVVDSRARAARQVRHNRVLKHLFFTSGVHCWEVYVSRMGYSAAMVVGVVTTEGFDSETLNGPLSSWTDSAIGYAADGAIIQNGVEVAHVERFCAGDCVGVQVDLNARTIAFFLNGNELTRFSSATYGVYKPACPVTTKTTMEPSSFPVETLQPLRFTAPALFAAVTLAPDTDEFDVYAIPCFR